MSQAIKGVDFIVNGLSSALETEVFRFAPDSSADSAVWVDINFMEFDRPAAVFSVRVHGSVYVRAPIDNAVEAFETHEKIMDFLNKRASNRPTFRVEDSSVSYTSDGSSLIHIKTPYTEVP